MMSARVYARFVRKKLDPPSPRQKRRTMFTLRVRHGFVGIPSFVRVVATFRHGWLVHQSRAPRSASRS